MIIAAHNIVASVRRYGKQTNQTFDEVGGKEYQKIFKQWKTIFMERRKFYHLDEFQDRKGNVYVRFQ